MSYLITRRINRRLVAAKTAQTAMEASTAATSMFSFAEPDGAYRRAINAIMTYDGESRITAGEITIEPIGVNNVS